jgi:hypothetical protein
MNSLPRDMNSTMIAGHRARVAGIDAGLELPQEMDRCGTANAV